MEICHTHLRTVHLFSVQEAENHSLHIGHEDDTTPRLIGAPKNRVTHILLHSAYLSWSVQEVLSAPRNVDSPTGVAVISRNVLQHVCNRVSLHLRFYISNINIGIFNYFSELILTLGRGFIYHSFNNDRLPWRCMKNNVMWPVSVDKKKKNRFTNPVKMSLKRWSKPDSK